MERGGELRSDRIDTEMPIEMLSRQRQSGFGAQLRIQAGGKRF